MKIKVCGPRGASCDKAETSVQAALGVLSTPAIVIDGVIKGVARVPAPKEIQAWTK
ncbi:MAG: hypothetical protein PHI06_06880 [Desulfobulbaceae bacterium]|nr:hypothetical protein [Desulfobulbaceae bacterium]